jgi:2-C-methyl-D-erythritol 2,4-cyclodiphosphate synthase
MHERAYVLGNADVTVICERPKVAPHADAMQRNLAADLRCAPSQISVKGTTSERLGFTGRGEGIAAQAVALLLPAR